jgi:glycyl-tRNA synthetase
MNPSNESLMDKIISLAKRRGFIFQGSEIYGGLAGTWDYGPLGVTLKNNIKNAWWQMFVSDREDMYGLDAAILMNQNVWKASGHVAGFSDPLAEDVKTKKRYRADDLVAPRLKRLK